MRLQRLRSLFDAGSYAEANGGTDRASDAFADSSADAGPYADPDGEAGSEQAGAGSDQGGANTEADP
jgi:hypothetical protein